MLASFVRVLTSQLATNNPWLAETTTNTKTTTKTTGEWAQREEERMAENEVRERHESSWIKATSVINCLFAANMLKRSSTCYSRGMEKLRPTTTSEPSGYLRCDYRLGQLATGGWPIGPNCGKLVCCALFALLAYCWLEVAASVQLMFQYDLAVSSFADAAPALALAGANCSTTETGSCHYIRELNHERGLCVRRDHLTGAANQEFRHHLSELARLEARLDQVGVPIRSQLGVNLFATLVVLSAPLVLYCLPMLHVRLVGRLIRLDSVSLLYEPLSERRRLDAVAKTILCDLAREQVAHARCIGTGASGPQAHKADHNNSLYRLREFPRFVQLLAEISQRQLVRPVVVASAWHRDLLRASKILALALPALCLGISFFFLAIYCLEIYTRALSRMAQDECARWHPNGTLLDSFNLLAQVQGKLQEAPFNDVRLIFFLAEARRFWTRPLVLVYMLKLGLLIVAMSSWFAFWSFACILGCLDKIAWLVQIRAQLLDCRQQVATIARRGVVVKFQRLDTLQVIDQVHEKLAIAYANYVLFRHQYQPFRSLSNFFIFHVCAFNTTGLMFLYLVALGLKSRANSQFRWLSVSLGLGQLVVMNTYMLVSLIDSQLIKSIMCQLGRLLALSAAQPALARKPALILWRRQLLTEEEVSMLASMQILTLRISYSRLAAFNVQLVVLLLLAWRTLEPR